jgi:hypothetical protein
VDFVTIRLGFQIPNFSYGTADSIAQQVSSPPSAMRCVRWSGSDPAAKRVTSDVTGVGDHTS